MVAETHSTYDGLTLADVVDYIVNVIAGLDLDAEEATSVELAACGVTDTPSLLDLAVLVGEEYGERTLVQTELDEIDPTWTVTDFVTLLHPDLDGAPDDGAPDDGEPGD